MQPMFGMAALRHDRTFAGDVGQSETYRIADALEGDAFEQDRRQRRDPRGDSQLIPASGSNR